MADEIRFMYLPIAARGEVPRMIMTLNGLKYVESFPGMDKYKEASLAAGFTGSLPILEHGSFKMYQSQAIESYLASLCPAWSVLTPQQKGIDAMFSGTKDDMISSLGGLCFGGTDYDKMPATYNQCIGILEKFLPDSGFVHGYDFPTTADFVVLLICKGMMPFKRSIEVCQAAGKPGYEIEAKFPKFAKHAAFVAEFPALKTYLAEDKFMSTKVGA